MVNMSEWLRMTATEAPCGADDTEAHTAHG